MHTEKRKRGRKPKPNPYGTDFVEYDPNEWRPYTSKDPSPRLHLRHAVPLSEVNVGVNLKQPQWIAWDLASSTDEGCPDWHWKSGASVIDSRRFRCNTRVFNTLSRCRKTRVMGTHHCVAHGSKQKHVVKAVEQRKREAEVVEEIDTLRKEMRMGEGPLEDRDPTLVLGDLLGLVRGDILAVRSALVTIDLDEEITSKRASIVLDQYGRMIDRAARMAETLVKVKQADRSLNMAESTQALERLQRVAALGKNPEYRDAAVKVAAMMRDRLQQLDEQTDDLANGTATVLRAVEPGEVVEAAE
jgi:hypothetical protein